MDHWRLSMGEVRLFASINERLRVAMRTNAAIAPDFARIDVDNPEQPENLMFRTPPMRSSHAALASGFVDGHSVCA